MKRAKVASYGTCPTCQKVIAVLSAGVLREHRADQRLNPHAVATVECLGGGKRWAEYDADVAAAQAGQLPPAPITVPTPATTDKAPAKVLDLDAVQEKRP